jgi:hypothetical protein
LNRVVQKCGNVFIEPFRNNTVDRRIQSSSTDTVARNPSSGARPRLLSIRKFSLDIIESVLTFGNLSTVASDLLTIHPSLRMS